MNSFIATEYIENIHRLALGIHPFDPIRESGLLHHVRVDIERGLPHIERDRRAPFCRPQTLGKAPDGLCRHNSGRYTLLYYSGINDVTDLRLYDYGRYYVPRRLRIPLLSLEDVLNIEQNEFHDYYTGRVHRPALFPGAAYDISARATGLRGRVLRDGEPMRWAVVAARLPGSGTVVGRARGDDRGEFLLLLSPTSTPAGDLDASGTVQVEVIIAGPNVVPTPDTPELPSQDNLWDLPLEQLPAPDMPDDVSSGEVLPPGYVVSTTATRNIDFLLGRMMTGVDVADFVFTLP
ncbi:MAG: hypothetical protein ACU85E_16525 [Gammaproteobacteria bacterium]